MFKMFCLFEMATADGKKEFNKKCLKFCRKLNKYKLQWNINLRCASQKKRDQSQLKRLDPRGLKRKFTDVVKTYL